MSEVPRFLSVARVAEALDGISEMTLYRAIKARQFPAIRVGRRLLIPADVLPAMRDQAMATGEIVNAADWVARTAA